MTDLSQQTELLLKALNTVHKDLEQLNYTNMIIGAIMVAILLIIAFRRRP
jgi:hypothetical protein